MTPAAATVVSQTPDLPAGFLPLADAAPRLGKSPRQLRRQCVRWAALGLARKHGGDWIIAKSADPRLADFETEEGKDLRQVAELAKEGYSVETIQRAEVIQDVIQALWNFGSHARSQEGRRLEFRNKCLSDGTLERLGIAKLSTRTLRRWEDAYERRGLRGLIRSPYPVRGSTAFGEKAQAKFVEVLKVGHGIPVTAVRDQVFGAVEEDGLQHDPAWRVPAPRTAQVWAKKNIPRAAKILMAEGPHKMRAKAIPKIRRDVLADYAAGELLIGDERTLDFMARQLGDRGWYRLRLKITAWRDAVSGKIVGWYIGRFANSDTILAAFEQAVLGMGTLPREVYVDNGLDYKSVGGPPRRNRKWEYFETNRFQTAFERLGVKVHYATPRYPWVKAVESSFAGLKDFDRFQASFRGGSPAERPFDAERWTKMNVFELPTIEEVRERFREWLEAYHETPRQSLGTEALTPNQAFTQFYTTRPPRVDKDTLDLLCRKLVGPTRIGRDGVCHQRMRYGTFDEQVWRMQGREVWMLVDAIDRDSVILCQVDGTPICTGNVDRPLGYKSEEVRDRIAFQRRCEKSIKQYAPSRDYLLKTPAAQIAERRRLAAQARQIPDQHLPPKPEVVSVEIVRPDLAPAVEKIKRAAGAEAMRRLHGLDAAAEAMNRPRPVTLAELDARTPVEPEEKPARTISLKELDDLSERLSNAP